MPRRILKASVFVCLAAGLLACERKPAPILAPSPSPTAAKKLDFAPKPAEGAPFVKVPLGLDTNLNIPADDPLTPEKIELGRLLYFDKRISSDSSISCATCHDPQQGWSDNKPVSTGIHGGSGTRNAPTVVNSTYMLLQFWDGRAKNLEEQALGPIVNPVEMGMASHEAMVNNLSKLSAYKPLFAKAFGDEKITKERVVQAIASFERTVLGGNSRYDRYSAGETTAMSAAEVRGKDLFFGKANCTRCHVGSNFSDSDFHNLGVGMSKPKPDLGRYDVTKDDKDRGAFKTPSVRDVTRHPPYMHDGSQKTLEEVIEFYDKGGEPNQQLDFRVVKLGLTPEEKADLLAFLKALESETYPTAEEPKEFPK